MSVIRRLTERRSLPTSIDPYQITARPFFPNYSGEIVTELTAFASTAVMSAVSLLADSVATMPLELTRQRAGRVEKLPTPSVLIKPNAHQTMFEFVHQTMRPSRLRVHLRPATCRRVAFRDARVAPEPCQEGSNV